MANDPWITKLLGAGSSFFSSPFFDVVRTRVASGLQLFATQGVEANFLPVEGQNVVVTVDHVFFTGSASGSDVKMSRTNGNCRFDPVMSLCASSASPTANRSNASIASLSARSSPIRR